MNGNEAYAANMDPAYDLEHPTSFDSKPQRYIYRIYMYISIYIYILYIYNVSFSR